MSKALKSSLIIGGTLVAVVVIIVVSLEFLSRRMHDNPRATLLFATSARTLHEKLQPGTLDDIAVLADDIAAAGPTDNTSTIQSGIVRGQLAAHTYWETFTYIQPTTDSLDLFTNLQREASYIATGYAKLATALNEMEAGRRDLMGDRLSEARGYHDKAAALRQQNTSDLDDLIASTEAKLSK